MKRDVLRHARVSATWGPREPARFRLVALPAPTEREKSRLFLQRYFRHFPAGGEIVIFDRSWYNRAGVEPARPQIHRSALLNGPSRPRGIDGGPLSATSCAPGCAVILSRRK